MSDEDSDSYSSDEDGIELESFSVTESLLELDWPPSYDNSDSQLSSDGDDKLSP